MSRPNLQASSRSRAFLVSILGGLTLLALAATVFAVASQARSVSSEAEQSVRIIEDLRVVSIARAELSIASRVSALGPDQIEVLAATLENAEQALDAVETNFDSETPPLILEAFDEYRIAAEAQASLIRSGSPTFEQAVDAEVATGVAFDRLSEVLKDEQIDALERLREDNDLMNVISTFATFVVAFVVPSAALYIFEALRRTPRHARELELEFENSSATSLAMAAAVAKEATHLRRVVDSLPAELHTDDVRRSVLRFEHVAALNGAVRTLHNEDLQIDALAMDVTRSIGEVIAVDTSDAVDAVVHGDRDQVTLVIFELLHNAVTHGAAPFGISITADRNSVSIIVTDHGTGLPDVVEDAVIHDNEYAIRGNLLSGTYGFGLLAARSATESLGGRIGYHRGTDETSLLVELPKMQLESAAGPVQVTLSDALEGRAAA